YCAFWIFGPDTYEKSESLDAFLGKTTEHLDNTEDFTDENLTELADCFHRAMRNAYKIFGDHAFRKWPLGTERRNPINRALFEVWAVVLSHYDEKLVSEHASDLCEAARRLMTD